MAKIRDRGEDFKHAARLATISQGFDEAKLAVVFGAFIIHKPRGHSSFIKAALTTLESIRTLEQFLLKHWKDYADLYRSSELERDNIECEVMKFIKDCTEQIDVLKNGIVDEEANMKGWFGTQAAHNINTDIIAHKHGVILILSEKLHASTSQYDHLRAKRLQVALNKGTPRIKPRWHANASSSFTNIPEFYDNADTTNAAVKVQQQVLEDETQALQVELASLLDAVHETETKMIEMSALNHLVASHVLQQAQQIEALYEQAVEATKNVELGNKELSRAVERRSGSRTFLLLFLIVLTLSVLFLDWYDRL